jgi:hypothetical protein
VIFASMLMTRGSLLRAVRPRNSASKLARVGNPE